VSITLLSDCEIKSAEKIAASAIQAALQQLDRSSLPSLPEVKGKIDKLKTDTESLRSEFDKVAQIIDSLKFLAPPDVREKYENFKSKYDRAKTDYDEWNTKYETLVRDLDRIKISIVKDTFQRFIESGVPIEIDLQEVEGQWQYDGYEVAVRLIEKHYRSILAVEFEKRIQEMHNAINRLPVL
jgi:chromosome segregation ATPase